MTLLRSESVPQSYFKNHVIFLSISVFILIGNLNGVSIREFVMMGNVESADDTTISAAISDSGLELEEFGNGLETKLGDPENDAFQNVRKSLGYKQSGDQFIVFSGGQQRRLDIAQLLTRLGEARFLILDELEANLDAGKFELLDKILAVRPKNCTVLLITHCMEMTSRGVDLIYVMKEGKMVEHGTHEELMKLRDGTYYRLQMADKNRRFGSTVCCPKCRQVLGPPATAGEDVERAEGVENGGY